MNRRGFLKLGAMTAAAMAVPAALVPRETPAANPDMLHSGDCVMWQRFAAVDFGYQDRWRNAVILDLHCPLDKFYLLPKGEGERLEAQFWAGIIENTPQALTCEPFLAIEPTRSIHCFCDFTEVSYTSL